MVNYFCNKIETFQISCHVGPVWNPGVEEPWGALIQWCCQCSKVSPVLGQVCKAQKCCKCFFVLFCFVFVFFYVTYRLSVIGCLNVDSSTCDPIRTEFGNVVNKHCHAAHVYTILYTSSSRGRYAICCYRGQQSHPWTWTAMSPYYWK